MTKKRSVYILVSLMTLVASALCGSYVNAEKATPRSRTTLRAPQAAPRSTDKQLYGFECPSDFSETFWGGSGAVMVMPGIDYPEGIQELDGSIFQAAYMDGKAFVVFYDAYSPTNVGYKVFDTESWEVESSISYTLNSSNILPYSLTYDHTTGNVYGCFFANTVNFHSTTDAQFGRINFADASNPTIIISNLPTRMRAMTTDAKGNLFGLSFEGDLYSINKFTGEATKTGIHVELPTVDGGDLLKPSSTYGRESMCCDWESGDFFIAYGDDGEFWSTYVAQFNPNVGGNATLYADYSYSESADDYGSGTCNVLTGLYFKQSATAPSKTTPAAPTDMTVTAVGTELKANVTFTMPSVDTEGQAIDSNLTWTVTDGNNELATGTARSGAQVTTTVSVSARGTITFVATAALDGAVSNPASTSAFIGCDTPLIYGLPTVRAAGMKLTVSWNAAEATNDGNLDPITYKVTRMPDNVVVAQANTTTSFVDVITSDIKTLYSYIIQPISGSVEGTPVTSRSIYAGKYIAVPLDENFDDEQRFLQYPIIDANGDDNIWEYYSKNGGAAMYPANGKPADDYLLIGPFKMEAGETYSFHMTANGHNYNETIALYAGTDPYNVASFSTELVPPTIIEPIKGAKSFDVTFEPTAAADYYFGIKACSSNASSQFIYVYDVAVKAIGGDAPAAPIALELIPEAKSATIRCTLPEKRINGTQADKLTAVNVYRDNSLIATVTDGVAPGATFSFSDTDEEVSKGYHSYSIAAVNADGEGKVVSGQLWRGADIPGRPSNLRIWEDLDTPGLMHLSFDHPARGYYGGYVNPDEIYYLVNYMVMGVASGVGELGYGTEHTFKLPFNITSQDIFAGSVYGRNSEGSVAATGNWITQTAYFGPAMSLPIHDSWVGMSQQSKGLWGSQNTDNDAIVGQSYWDITDGSSSSVRPQDNDGGMKSFSTSIDNGGKRMLSPRMTLEGADSPTLVFYYLYSKKALEFNLEIFVDDKPATIIKSFDLKAADADKWIRVEIPLSDYKSSKYLQFGFAARSLACEDAVCIDNVTISDLKTNNLSIISFSAPEKVDANNDAALVVGVRNNGSVTVEAANYSVRFYKNDQLLAEIPGKQIAPDTEISFRTTDCPTVADPAEIRYRAEAIYAADKNTADNSSATSVVRLIIAEYPTVTDLKASPRNGVELTWSDPDMSEIPGVSVTETFETYESFIIDNIGPWTTHDGDGCNTVIMSNGMGVLEYPHIGEPMAWQVFDPGEVTVLNAAWYARSGSKMLVSFQASEANDRQSTSDDWLISPELNATEQTISFYARAGLKAYAPEIFDFMISDKTNAVADFKPLASDVEVPYTTENWTEFVYRVPAGTRHFAIVHKSFGKMGMLVDDITYIPAGSAPVKLDLEGFNVYRDGKRITDEPVGDNSYTDSDVEAGKQYTYHVSAVWDKGESPLSEPVTITATALDNVTTYSLTISGHQGFIRICGGIGEQADIYTTSGVCVASVKAEGTIEIPVARPGVYVVRAGGSSAKVAVL